MTVPGYTGRTRRRWFIFTQYEYAYHGYTGARWQTPWNTDRWPVAYTWTYAPPSSASVSP